ASARHPGAKSHADDRPEVGNAGSHRVHLPNKLTAPLGSAAQCVLVHATRAAREMGSPAASGLGHLQSLCCDMMSGQTHYPTAPGHCSYMYQHPEQCYALATIDPRATYPPGWAGDETLYSA